MWPSPSNSMLPVVNPPTPPLPWKHRRVFHGFGGKRLGATPRWRGPQAERNGGGFSSRWCIGWVGENGRGWIYWLIGCCWSLSQDLCLDVVGYYWKCQNSCRMHLVQGIFKQKSWLVKKWRCLSHFDKRWILKKLPWHFVLHLYNYIYIHWNNIFWGDRSINPGHQHLEDREFNHGIPHHRHGFFLWAQLTGYERWPWSEVLTCIPYPYHPWDWYIYV